MRNKHMLTIEDLIEFCEQRDFSSFNSQETGYSLHVQVPCENFEIDKNEDPLTFFGNVRLMHTGKNRNKSNLTEQAAKGCLSKIAYKPVLADFTDVNGERDFTYHTIEYNDDGSRTYIERQVGCFTSDRPYMEQDEEHADRKYIYARAAIPREYTDAADIIERKGGTKISVELAINKMSYSIEDGLLLEDVDVMGATLLGTDPETGDPVQEGMENAYLQIEDFSAENNTVINTENLIEEITAAVLSKLDDKKNYRKEENEVDKLINEATEEEVVLDSTETPKVVDNFDGDDPGADPDNGDQELDTPGDDPGENQNTETPGENQGTQTPGENQGEQTVTDTTDADAAGAVDTLISALTDESTAEAVEEARDAYDALTSTQQALVTTLELLVAQEARIAAAEDEESEDEGQSVSAIEDEDSSDTVSLKVPRGKGFNEKKGTNTLTIILGDKNFELSLSSIQYAIETVVNEMYSESDNTYYGVIVYAESKTVVMIDMWNSNNAYRQSYKERKGVYSLVGSRVPVHSVWVTADEEAEFDKIRSNYSAIENELASYKSKELHSAREKILSSKEYTVMNDYDEFKELRNNMDEYSVEDLTKKADLVFAKFMKENYSTYSTNSRTKNYGMVFMSSGDNTEEERLPYGGLFKNFKSKKR